jgi:hypothetical protein
MMRLWGGPLISIDILQYQNISTVTLIKHVKMYCYSDKTRKNSGQRTGQKPMDAFPSSFFSTSARPVAA